MLPHHKSPKWVRLLKGKMISTQNWGQYRKGWPRAWAAQDQLMPILQVLFVLRAEISPSGREILGGILLNAAWNETHKLLGVGLQGPDPLDATHRATIFQLPEITEDTVREYFGRPLEPVFLNRQIMLLWRSLAKLSKNYGEFSHMEHVVYALENLNTNTFGPVQRSKANVIDAIRRAYGTPSLL